MAFYLLHHFDPNVSQRKLKPSPKAKDSLHNLGYVQNVQAGDLLAEFRSPESVKYKEARFMYKEPIFPQGQNTYIDAQNPHRLLASTKGYVTYEQGKISVLSTLKVHGDVSFHTGNIIFTGDTAIAGNVRTGFEVYGDNVLITGMVKGAKIRANKNLQIVGGVSKGSGNNCLLNAQQDIRVGFAERVVMQSKGNITVEKNCLHSTLYVGRNALIKGRLVGGTLHGRQGVFIGEHVGNHAKSSTRIFLGYNPRYIRRLESIDEQLEELRHSLYHLNAVAGHLDPQTNDLTKKLYKQSRRKERLLTFRQALLDKVHIDEEHNKHCKIIVMGIVYPGVEIAIGQEYLLVEKELRQVIFSLVEDQIICSPYTPKKKL